MTAITAAVWKTAITAVMETTKVSASGARLARALAAIRRRPVFRVQVELSVRDQWVLEADKL